MTCSMLDSRIIHECFVQKSRFDTFECLLFFRPTLVTNMHVATPCMYFVNENLSVSSRCRHVHVCYRWGKHPKLTRLQVWIGNPCGMCVFSQKAHSCMNHNCPFSKSLAVVATVCNVVAALNLHAVGSFAFNHSFR